MVRLQDSTKKKREYLPPFMIASYFYGDEKGNIVNIIWWLSFLSNAAVYVEFVSTIINMQYKGYCLNMAQHLRLSVARKIKLLIFKWIWGILFHNLNVNGSIFSTQWFYMPLHILIKLNMNHQIYCKHSILLTAYGKEKSETLSSISFLTFPTKSFCHSSLDLLKRYLVQNYDGR